MKLQLRTRRKRRARPRVVKRAASGSTAAKAPESWRSNRHESHGAAPDRAEEPSRRAPPVKQPTWEWYVPIYFWSGGIAAGAWLAAAAEDIAGEGDRDLIRVARYISATGIAASTVILIADLGRPDRFLNMLRIVRARSTMSLGAWGLTGFGAWSGAAALLQALDDGLLGERPIFARLSRGHAGWLLHALGLPLALFVGGYTGVLLGTTSAPAWARRARLLGPLFITSAASTGFSAVSLALEAGAGARNSAALRRLARAESAALVPELALALINRRRVHALPSARAEPPVMRSIRALTLTAGMALPLVAHIVESRSRERSAVSTAAAILTLAGGLSLRFLTTVEGKRSARTPDDSWVH
ncbi:MAG TPA: NrfD/PsrC family molybdoenzyme membrane anchor subunit, partial [Gemmatimonadaceae bacterium]|nr:NrfD/PsrC family molybdoenzyme membrane anchor subunit [Gemmatimonadaceae bacterium]